MTQTDAEALLIEVLDQIQEAGSRKKTALSPSLRPLLDLPEFDSLNGVEATVEVLDRLKLGLKFNNLFLADDNGKPLSIRQAAARLVGHTKEVGAS